MPDSIPAVGAEIRPPNPIQTFSNVLGLRQQQLAIQQAQANVQSAQAGAAQAQQQNQELQQAQSLATAAKNGAYRNQDGSLNTQKLSEDVQNIGPYAANYANQIVSRANEMVANQTAINSLNTNEQQQLSDVFLSLAGDKNLTHSEIIDSLNAAVERNPQFARIALSWASGIPPNANSAQLQQLMKQFALASHSTSAQPQISLTQGPGGLQITQTNPYSPLGAGVQGKPVPQGLSPQIITQPGTGGVFKVGPGTNVTPVGGGQQPPPPQNPTQPQKQNWWQPAPFQMQMYQQNVDALVKRVQAGVQAANTTPQALDALDRMRAILDQGTWTGTAFSGFKDLKNLAASIGLDTTGAQNASELVKNMARYEAARASAVGDTDASRALVEAGSPNFKMDANAVKSVVLQSIGNERIIQSYANLMQSAPTPQVAMQREQQFRSIPHLLQMLELGELHSKPEVDEFLKRYDLSGKELAKSYQMYQKLMATAQNGV